MASTQMWAVRRPSRLVVVELEETDDGDLVLWVVPDSGPELPVVRACRDAAGTWHVRALLAGHEEVAQTVGEARALALADFDEIFDARLDPIAGPTADGPVAVAVAA